MSLPLLTLSGLQKAHTVQKPFFCAEIAHLTVWPGQAVGITGSSGCGKSTVLEMVALLTKPDTCLEFTLNIGRTSIDLSTLWNKHPEDLARIRRELLGFVHQAGGLFPYLSCYANIALPLLLSGSSPTERAQRVEELLDFLGLRHVANQLPEQLSYGERQRTAIARALIHRPRLILADEPTSALDPDSARSAMKLLVEGARETNAALLVVSHDHELLRSVGIPALAMRLAKDSDENARHYVLADNRQGEKTEQPEAQESQESKESKETEKSKAPAFWPSVYLAWRDFWHEYALSLCAVLAFAAALTPITILSGLRFGIIDVLTQRFLNNPASLTVNPYGSRYYTDADIAELRDLPGVRFIVPETRKLSSTVLILRSDKPPITADVVPTAIGDPLLTRVPNEGEVVVTQELARSFTDLRENQVLELVVNRRVRGEEERVKLPVRVVGILPDASDWKAHVYLPLPVLLDMERYRDGYAVPERSWKGGAAPDTANERSYAGFRMYVNDPPAVLSIRDALKERGIEAWTAAREVETIQALSQALTLITVLVAVVTIAGMALSLASLTVSSVRRKARLFAQARLMGLGRGQILTIPFLQMIATAFFAASITLVFYGIVALLIHAAASPWLLPGESACTLRSSHIALLYAGAIVIACFSALSAAIPVLSLQPAEVLRREN